jgi:hypothetical protein
MTVRYFRWKRWSSKIAPIRVQQSGRRHFGRSADTSAGHLPNHYGRAYLFNSLGVVSNTTSSDNLERHDVWYRRDPQPARHEEP